MSTGDSRQHRSEWAVLLDDVSVHYRTQKAPSLHDLNLRIAWGEKVAVIGASGSGKSSLVHLLNGLIPHRHKAKVTGTVLVGGVDPQYEPLTTTSASVGTVLQDSDAQFVALTVAEDIAFSLENQQLPPASMPSAVERVAERVAARELLEQSPHSLSGGQKQRVAVGGVLVDDVPILLFDEPLANLDPATGLATIDLIDSLHDEAGKTVLIVEHRLEEVLRRHVDRVIVMDQGRIVADESPDRLVAGPLLRRLGIRPPLHLTALRHAGIDLADQQHPARLSTMRLTDAQLTQLRQWSQEHAAEESPLSAAGSAPAVEFRGVTCTLGRTRDDVGVTALRDVSLTVSKGELLAVLGTNGAGKSTLARAIAGFDRPDSGQVLIAGRDSATLSVAEIGRSVAYVLQDPNQMISKSMIADEVALGPRALGLEADEVQRRVDEALEVCGLRRYRSWPISALSHGQRKRVTIAAALVMQPEILLLDEPTAGQDLRHYTEFMEFVQRIHERGTTVIIVTHDMHLALEHARRVVVMHDGRIIADDTPEAVLADKAITATASLVPTSLQELAEDAGLPESFVQAVIAADRSERDHG